MDGMVSRSRVDHLGTPTSLCDLGYCDVGLDDNWQACGSYGDAGNYNFHDETGGSATHLHRFALAAGFSATEQVCFERGYVY